MSTKYEIPRGKALVITGAQSSGKSRLARLIASQYGRTAEIRADDLTSPFALGEVLSSKPDVLIVEGECNSTHLKRMITEKSIVIHRKGLAPSRVSSPRVIVVSNSASVQPLFDGARRYQVLECRKPYA